MLSYLAICTPYLYEHTSVIKSLGISVCDKSVIDCLRNWLLFGVNENLLTQHITGPVTKYKMLKVSNQCRAGARAWARVRSRAKGYG